MTVTLNGTTFVGNSAVGPTPKGGALSIMGGNASLAGSNFLENAVVFVAASGALERRTEARAPPPCPVEPPGGTGVEPWEGPGRSRAELV